MKKISLYLMAVTALLVFANCKGKGSISEADLKSELEKIVGAKGTWEIAYFKDLKKDMPCADVKKIYSDLTCEDDKEYSFPEVKAKDNKIIEQIKFTFKSGKLSSGSLEFKKSLSKDVFKSVSLGVFEAKWGEVKEKDKDILTWIGPDYVSTQRTYMVDHFELENSFSK